jgi:tetratricopeptide (TPR) repeat protein
MDLAAGLPDAAESDRLVGHAAGCDSCAQLLREAVDVLHGEAPPAEVLTSVAARRQQYLHDMTKREPPSGLRWMYAAAAVLVCALVGVLAWRNTRMAPDPLPLLAKAYESHRNVELRIPGSAHSPYRVERGQANNETPVELLEAEALIQRRLAGNRGDVDTLAAQGRAAILRWQAALAIQSLESAAARVGGGSRPEIWIDLATAYFQRGEQNQDKRDDEIAAEWLSKAIAARPQDEVALFNRAIVKSRLGQKDSAAADLQTFLQVSKDPAWRAEASQRLQELQPKPR